MLSEHGAATDAERQAREQLIRAICALSLLAIASSMCLMYVEDWDFWRGLFFTLITITTVGYGDEGISPDGQKFASLLMVVGIGLTTYTFALLVHWTVQSRLAWRKRMQSKIDKLRHHSIICGFGRMGQPVCRQLASAGAPFVVVDRDPAGFERAVNAGYLAIEGTAIDDDVLLRAGVERADSVVACVDDRSENIVITLSARAYRPTIRIIARAERDDEARKLHRAGASQVVRPFESGGLEIANAILRPQTAELFAQLIDNDHGLRFGEVVVREGSALEGVALSEYGRSAGSQINFVALKRQEKELEIRPRGSLELQAGDVLVVAGDPEQVETMVEGGRGG